MGMDPTQLQQIVQESMAAVVPMEIDSDRPSQSVGTVPVAPAPENEPRNVEGAPGAPGANPVPSAAPLPPQEPQNAGPSQGADAKSPAAPPEVPGRSPAVEGDAQADDVGAPMEDLIREEEHDANN